MYFLLGKNLMNRIAWLATVHGVGESDVTEHACTLCICYICCRRDLCFLHTCPGENKAVRGETASRNTWYCRTNCLSSWTISSLTGTVQYSRLTAPALLLNAATEHLQFSCFSFFFNFLLLLVLLPALHGRDGFSQTIPVNQNMTTIQSSWNSVFGASNPLDRRSLFLGTHGGCFFAPYIGDIVILPPVGSAVIREAWCSERLVLG